jgi:hypothetical protein
MRSAVLQAMSRRRGVGVGSGGGGGGTPGIVAAVLTQQGTPTTGSLRWTGGFLLPPSGDGALAPADHRKLSIWIGGVEQSIHTEALYGQHNTGNAVAIRYDFDYTVTSTSNVALEVRIGTTRATTDRTRRTITKTDADNARWVLATDPAWLTRTRLTLMNLVPRSLWNATEEAYLGALSDAVLASAITSDSDIGATPYDHGRILAGLYCCTGTLSYLKRAIAAAQQRYDYYMPSGSDWSSTHAPAGKRFETPTESQSVFEHTMRIAYLITGCGDYWGPGNFIKQAHSRTRSSLTIYQGDVFRESYADAGVPTGRAYSGFRFNLRNLRWWTVSQYTGQTFDYDKTDESQPARATVYATEVPWALTAMDDNRYTSALGAYRANIRGAFNMTLQPGLGYTPTPTWQAGDFPLFQLAISTDWLLDIYTNVYADSRIPGWIKTNVDVALANHFPLPSTHRDYSASHVRYGAPYLCYSVPFDVATMYNSANGGDQEELAAGRLLAPMWIRSLAFLAQAYPSDVVNGATYATWRDRFMHPEQAQPSSAASDWTFKEYGEIFQPLDAPHHRINGVTAGPTTIFEPATATGAPT